MIEGWQCLLEAVCRRRCCGGSWFRLRPHFSVDADFGVCPSLAPHENVDGQCILLPGKCRQFSHPRHRNL